MNTNVKRCLVLGGKGFIGSNLVDRLKSLGNYVRVFDRPKNSGDNIIEVKKGVEYYKGDFVNEKDLEIALEGIDYVFHLICTTTPKTSNDNPEYDVETNLIGTIKLLEIIKRKNSLKIIFISSGGTVYGIVDNYPINEQQATKPICAYGICKLAIENYLHAYHYLHGLNYTVLRVSNPYGKNQNPKSIQGAVSVFMDKILKNRKITIWGNGEIARDFIYIDDVIEAFILAMDSNNDSRIFNIGSGKAITINQLVKEIKIVSGRSPKIEYLPARDLDVPINYLDISLARSELKWMPMTSLNDGLRKTWEWMCSRRSSNDAG